MSRHQQNLTEAIHGQVLSRWKRELLWKQSIPQNYANSYYFITNVFYWDLRQGCCLETLLASYLFSSLKSCQFAQQSLLVLYGVSEKVMLRLWHLLGNKGRFKKKRKSGTQVKCLCFKGFWDSKCRTVLQVGPSCFSPSFWQDGEVSFDHPSASDEFLAIWNLCFG